ncbi:MFS transporter [Clostridium massiliamazoniense]|uniref:MFS transporter n=1 Tax=Clostridium massiliamazoniense TaxID=1347366 RepID=UPI0006D78600|nr:MFS transporter [Clostridium massiliamazoniense]
MINKTKDKNYNLVMLLLLWGGIVVMSSLYMTIPLIHTFSTYFSTNTSNATLTSSIFSIFFAIGCLFYGALSNKYGRKKIILLGLIFLSIFSLLAGFSNNLTLLIIFRALQGLAAATFSPVALAYIMDFFPNDRKVLAISFISTGFLMAGILGQDVSMILSNYFNWKYIFFLFSFIYILTFIILYIFIPAVPIANPNMSIANNFKDLKNVIKIKNLRFAYIISFVILLSFVYMYTSLNDLLVTFNLDNNDVVYINFIGIIGMFFSPLSNKLIKRFNNIPVLRFSILLSVVSFALLGFTNNIALLTILSILFVLGIALAVPSLISIIGLLGGNHRANALSLHTFILFLGTSLAPILSTYTINDFGFLISFIVGAIILFLGVIATFLIEI